MEQKVTEILKLMPCKIGDMVFQICSNCIDCHDVTNWCHKECKKQNLKIRSFIVNHFHVYVNGIEIHGHGIDDNGFWGKTVFLSKKDAVEAMKIAGEK